LLLWQHLLDGLFLLLGEVRVLVELGLESLHFLELLNERGAGVVALEVGHDLRLRFEALRLHEVGQTLDGRLELLDDPWGFVDEPDFARRVGLGARK
jgi:hypothetical protein